MKTGAKNKAFVAILAIVTCILLLCATASAGSSGEQGPPRAAGLKGSGITEVPETVRVLMPDNSVRTMYMDDYLKGVVPSEVSPSWPYDALCAQAVAARCYASTSYRHPSQGANV
jgi:peptidoglycan hydrolase-like amidase